MPQHDRRHEALAVPIVAAPDRQPGAGDWRPGLPHCGARPLIVSVGFGHVPGAPLILTRLTDAGRAVPVQSAQWWLDQRELRLVLIDPGALREELTLRARRNGHVYDGRWSAKETAAGSAAAKD